MALLFLSTSMVSFGFAENNVDFDKERAVNMGEPLKLAIELSKRNYTLDESITVKCRIENLQGEEVNLKLLSSDISVYLRYEADKTFSRWDSLMLPRELLNEGSIKKIGSGESYYLEEVISKETYPMPKKSGKYELYAMYRNGMKKLKGIKLWLGEVRSNTIEFEIQ
jgi:hypothetical protein